MNKNELATEFLKCCASEQWSGSLAELSPYTDPEDLFEKSSRCWFKINKSELMSALAEHPPIGVLKKGFSEQEQKGIQGSSEQILIEIREKNREYQEKFGFVFLICATGKSGNEILESLKIRLNNNKDTELEIASGQLNDINKIRLQKLLDSYKEDKS